jgi:DNA-binding IclR family transcriptional regulator
MFPSVEKSSVFGTKADAETVPAVERALDVLELLESSEGRLTLSEIVAQLGLPKGSAHRLLSTLKARGYIEQSGGARSGFGLGARVVALAARAQGQLDVVRAAREPMRRLAEATGEGCQLSIRSGGSAVCALRVAAPSHPEVALMGGVGSSFPLHAVAVGKALLAFAPPAEQEAYLAGELAVYTPSTIVDPARLSDELAAIRETGIARDDQEYKRGLRALAAPIFEANGIVRSALALPLLVGGHTDEPLIEIELRRAAAETSRAMGYRGED